MNFVGFILNVVKSRIISIEAEIRIMDEQLKVLPLSPGTTSKDITLLSLQRNIKATLHDLLIQYCHSMGQVSLASAPLQQAISCHLYTLKQDAFQILLQELYGQQSALTTYVGADYQKYMNDSDMPADIHLKMIALVFPWEFIIDLLNSTKFFTTLIKTVLNYNPKKHSQSVSVIFNQIRKFQTLPSLTKNNLFFTAKAPMYFALSEHLVTVFTHNAMMKVDWDPLRNFSTAEKCALIAQHGMTICELNQEIVGIIKKAADDKKNDPNRQSASDIFNYLRPIESIQPKNSSESSADIEKCELPELTHIILEIRKIPYQPSPSAMLFSLTNALQWLNAALTTDGRMVGADETFQFFAYCLSVAKLWCLPGIITFIDKFIDDALHETKYEYYIEQLRSSLEFIDNRLLPVQPFLVFPFADPPPNLIGKLNRVGSEPVQMKGFQIYAFPTWSDEHDSLLPSMINYTGGVDVSICYQYNLTNANVLELFPNFDAIPTLHGTFLQLTDQMIKEKCMIRVESGDYEKDKDDTEIISAMMLMSASKIKNPKTSLLDQIYANVKIEWHLRSPSGRTAIRTAVAEVQRALVILNSLPENFFIDGVLNTQTVTAMREFVKAKDNKLIVTPKVFNYIISSVRK
ncbi:hypothetical protein TRFO_14600 [Tritrichomonas foetus]|uniref:VPS9 domain-containing protein n=1 Tax=Tritrichomonas foetus TaxID=1144522 RepID=A0A1J4KZ12_9EUKA|nr:hypothetical protein TRFO_14600 [Tritrichomonas foetus]|eukprot:OHT14950.1 hypothetical protein TRFO_14600 [Tritrichomonas foetus]